MSTFNYSGYGRTRSKKDILNSPTGTIVPPLAFPNRPVMNLSENLPGNAGGAQITVADASAKFSFTDNVWPNGWQVGDPSPDRESDKPFSVSAWVQVAEDSPAHGQIVGKFGGNARAEWLLYARNGNDGIPNNDEGAGIYFMLFSDGAQYGGTTAHPNHPNPNPGHVGGSVNTGARLRIRTSQEVLQNDKWHHVMASYDGSRTASGLELYVDGVSILDIEGAGAFKDENNYVGMLKTDLPLVIGNSSDGSLAYERALTDVAIFNETLTHNHAVELYNRGSILPMEKFSRYDSIIGWWPLDPGDTAPTANETIGNENGTMTATAVIDGNSSNTIVGPFSKDIGYDTEGQRFLHLKISEAADIGAPGIQVWGQTTAAGRDRWTRLTAPAAAPSFANPNPGMIDTFSGVQLGSVTHKIAIMGIDKLFFIWNGNGGLVTIAAECSSY